MIVAAGAQVASLDFVVAAVFQAAQLLHHGNIDVVVQNQRVVVAVKRDVFISKKFPQGAVQAQAQVVGKLPIGGVLGCGQIAAIGGLGEHALEVIAKQRCRHFRGDFRARQCQVRNGFIAAAEQALGTGNVWQQGCAHQDPEGGQGLF